MRSTNLNVLDEVVSTPLGRLLEGVHPDVFEKPPRTVGLRDLQRGMSTILQKLRIDREYRVLTSRGAPTFLLIPIDPNAWTSLLAAAPPEMEFELDKARKQEQSGDALPDTDAVLEEVRGRLRS